LRRLLCAEVDEIILPDFPGRPHVLPLVDRLQAAAGPVVEDLAEEGDSFRAGAAQGAAFRPPDQVVGGAIGLPVAHICSRARPLPEPIPTLLVWGVSPALCEVDSVLPLAEDDGFGVPRGVVARPPDVGLRRAVLEAGVGHPSAGVVVDPRAIVNRAKVV